MPRFPIKNEYFSSNGQKTPFFKFLGGQNVFLGSNVHFFLWQVINILYQFIENKFTNLMVTSEFGVTIEKMGI